MKSYMDLVFQSEATLASCIRKSHEFGFKN